MEFYYRDPLNLLASFPSVVVAGGTSGVLGPLRRVKGGGIGLVIEGDGVRARRGVYLRVQVSARTTYVGEDGDYDGRVLMLLINGEVVASRREGLDDGQDSELTIERVLEVQRGDLLQVAIRHSAAVPVSVSSGYLMLQQV